jgi:hypothetical protein
LLTQPAKKFYLLLSLLFFTGMAFGMQPPDEPEPIPPALLSDTLTPEEPRQTGSATILDARVDYEATDSIFFDMRNQKVYLYGNADLKYGDIHLEAAYVEIDFRKNELFAKGMPDSAGIITGHPVFTEGIQSFESEQLRYNFETKRGWTRKVMTEEADGIVHGDVVKIQPDKVIHVQDGKYTTCDSPEPHFHIAFRRAKLIPNDKIITSVAYLVIAGVPTPLFVPFGFFPNKRGQASGVLIPSYGESNNRGFFLENGGFYWGINDYLDLAVRGDIYSRGSWALRTNSNYRVRYKYNGNVNLSYAINILGEPNLPGYERSRDFRVVWSHSQDPKARPNSTFRANVNAGSSQASRFNPISDRDYLSNTFSSNVSYTARIGRMANFSANLRHSQNTINRSVDLSLPELALSVNRFNPFERKDRRGEAKWYEEINMSYTVNARNEIRTTDSLLFRKETLSSFRNGMNHSIPVSHSMRILNHFNLSNRLSYTERWYLQSIEKSWDASHMYIQGGDTLYGREVIDTVPGFTAIRDFNYSASLGTTIYGMKQFRRGPLRAVRHVATPSLSFSYRPDFADPFWGYYQTYYNPVRDEMVRYAIFEGSLYGGPAPNRSGSLGFSLSNNLEIKVRDRSEEKGERKIALIDNFSISGSYDLARDSLNLSDISLRGRTRLFGNFDVTYSSTWTPYASNEAGQKINTFLWEQQRKLLKLNNTSWSLSFNYRLDSEMGKERDKSPGNGADDPNQMEFAGMDMNEFSQNGDPMGEDLYEDPRLHSLHQNGIDYSVPWSLQFSYSFRYNARYLYLEDQMDRSVVQNLGVSGDIRLTPKWRIGFRSGYDFDRKEITYTSVDLYRDLHCWEMTMNWIPFGFRRSYNFTIRVKSSVLQDLKLTRRTHHLDRAFGN